MGRLREFKSTTLWQHLNIHFPLIFIFLFIKRPGLHEGVSVSQHTSDISWQASEKCHLEELWQFVCDVEATKDMSCCEKPFWSLS